MTCDEARFAVLALLDDELDVAKSLEVLAHLDNCGVCQAEAERDDRLTVLVRQHLSRAPAAPAGLWRRIRDRIDREEGAPRPSDRRSWWAARLLTAIGSPQRSARLVQAAALALVVVMALVMLPSRPTPSFLAEEILADHLGSLRREGGPADVLTTDPSAVVARFRRSVRVPDQVPVLRDADSKLLGGSYCQLPSTRGIRFTYALGTDRTVSVYQLERPREAAAPGPGARPLYVGYYVEGAPRPGAILWGDERFLYAVVGDMPPTTLEELAHALLPHPS
jgi:anti-sigma factor RsiW